MTETIQEHFFGENGYNDDGDDDDDDDDDEYQDRGHFQSSRENIERLQESLRALDVHGEGGAYKWQ